MHLTYREIFDQYNAARRTYDLILSRKAELCGLFKNRNIERAIYIGAGSGYSVCKSAALSGRIHMGIDTLALPAGDLMLHFKQYSHLIKGALLISPTRSGSTTEVLKAVELSKAAGAAGVLSINAKAGAPLSMLSDLCIELPWAFDESVCQTRTVTNFYLANLLISALVGGDEALVGQIDAAVNAGNAFMADNEAALKQIGENGTWDNIVVLGDAELAGIAEEGALAFKEIPMMQSNHYHLLDVRHGPMVLIGPKTLVIAALSGEESEYQTGLLNDIKARGAALVTVGPAGQWPGDLHVNTPDYQSYAVTGIPFIYVPQLISYYKAVARGVNPDEPAGLSAWIELK